jgi:hypothetical protein
MRVIIPAHLRNLSLIRKAEVATVSDDNMLVDGEAHDFAGVYKLPCNGNIFGRRLGISRRVVMSKNERGRVVGDGRIDDLSRIDTAGG